VCFFFVQVQPIKQPSKQAFKFTLNPHFSTPHTQMARSSCRSSSSFRPISRRNLTAGLPPSSTC
jgi:hypothetical protein